LDHKKELVKLFNSLRYRYDMYTLFSDFVELGALAISNSVDKQQFEKREEKYLQVIHKYEQEETEVFPKMLAIVTDALGRRMTDILGEVYMELEISNKDTGQFFTPYDVAKMMAQMTISDHEDTIKDKGFFTVNEPAVGGGVTIIALAEALRNKGYNYQKQMRVVAQDIDPKSVHMSYLQFSLLGIDATVLRGNTLTLKMDEAWHTPMKYMNFIEEKQKEQQNKTVEGMRKAMELLKAHEQRHEPMERESEQLQLSLF